MQICISWLPSNKRRNKWPIKCWWRWRKRCAAWCRLISRNLRQTGNLDKSFYLHGLIRDSIEKIPSCGFGGIFVSFSISASLHSDLLLFSSETSSTLTSSWSERSSSFAMSSLSNFPVSSLFLRCLSFSRSVFRHFALLFWNQTWNYDVKLRSSQFGVQNKSKIPMSKGQCEKLKLNLVRGGQSYRNSQACFDRWAWHYWCESKFVVTRLGVQQCQAQGLVFCPCCGLSMASDINRLF